MYWKQTSRILEEKALKTREGRWKQMVAIGVALALLAAFFWWQNNGLTVSWYEFTSTKVPRELD